MLKATIKLPPGIYEFAQIIIDGAIEIEGLDLAETPTGRTLENEVGNLDVGRACAAPGGRTGVGGGCKVPRIT